MFDLSRTRDVRVDPGSRRCVVGSGATMFFWPLEQGAEMFRLARDLFADPSRGVNIVVTGIDAPPEPFVPQEHWFRAGYALLVGGVRSRRRRSSSGSGPSCRPRFEMVTQVPHAQLRQMFDEANAFGFPAYDKSVYVEDLSDDVIEVVTARRRGKITCLGRRIHPTDPAARSISHYSR